MREPSPKRCIGLQCAAPARIFDATGSLGDFVKPVLGFEADMVVQIEEDVLVRAGVKVIVTVIPCAS